MTVDAKAMSAVSNNANLYGAILTAQGIRFRRSAGSVVAVDPPPPYYANVMTLSPEGSEEQLKTIEATRNVTAGGFSCKDSFAALNLADTGLGLLLEAVWLWSPPMQTTALPATGWRRVDKEDDLALWEKAWRQAGSPSTRRVFPAQLLDSPKIAFFGRENGHGFVAGCIVNCSDDCVGLSNIFSRDNSLADYKAATECASAFAPGLSLVSYDWESGLDRLRAIGFLDVGRLRVWTAPPQDERRR